MTEAEKMEQQVEDAMDRIQTKKWIERIEAALCSAIKRWDNDGGGTVESTKAIAKAAECYFELSVRFWHSVPGMVEQHQSIKKILCELAEAWAETAETAKEVEALVAVSNAIKKIP